MSGALLDTCAVIWMADSRMPDEVASAIDAHALAGELFYSPISAWEIAMLGRPRREGPRLRFDPDPAAWFARFQAAPGLQEARLSAEIALAAALLPADVHADPADRLLIATARHRRIPLVTADRRIIDYAAQGMLDVIACHPAPETMP